MIVITKNKNTPIYRRALKTFEGLVFPSIKQINTLHLCNAGTACCAEFTDHNDNVHYWGNYKLTNKIIQFN